MDLDGLYKAIDCEEKSNSQLYNSENDALENLFWNKIELILKHTGNDIDEQNELYEVFSNLLAAVQRNAFKVGYRTALELTVKV